jgi:hypothetical protein
MMGRNRETREAVCCLPVSGVVLAVTFARRVPRSSIDSITFYCY